MVEIKNNQHSVNVTIGTLKKVGNHLLGIANYPDFSIGIFLTTPAKMREFNKEFRKKDAPTDILSFLYYQDIKPGEQVKAVSEEEKYLGDIIMCPEYIQEHLDQWPEKSIDNRLVRLLVHGFCHLLGYTHDTEENAAVMHTHEEYLLEKLSEHLA